MSFLSKIWKGVKKVVKGIGKAVKKFAGKLFGSTLGKILLGAIAIYTAGAIMGVFTNPFTAGGAIGWSPAMSIKMTEGGMSVLEAVTATVKETASGFFGKITGQVGEKAAEKTVTSIATDLPSIQTGADISAAGGNFGDSIFGAADPLTTGKELASASLTDIAAPEIGKTLATTGLEETAKKSIWRSTLQGINDNKLAFYVGANFFSSALDDSEEDAIKAAERARRGRWPGGDLDAGWQGEQAGQKWKSSQRKTLSQIREESAGRQHYGG